MEKPPARAAFCIQNAAIAAFRMRRRRGSVCGTAAAAPRAIFVERNASVRAISTPLSFPHGKESAVDGRKKEWQRGSFESPPLQTPLKRPRRGLRPPSLDFPRSLVRSEIDSDLQNAIQMRICQTGVVVEILCCCFGCTLRGSPFVRDMRDRPCKKDGLSTSIRQIFNGRRQNDLHCVSCVWETQSDGRPKGVLTTAM